MELANELSERWVNKGLIRIQMTSLMVNERAIMQPVHLGGSMNAVTQVDAERYHAPMFAMFPPSQPERQGNARVVLRLIERRESSMRSHRTWRMLPI
jgi:hypothetical protein